jgi:hypothetical protein
LGTSSPSLTLDVIVPSGTQTVALYFLDYDKQGRSESVSVTDTSNNPLSGPTAVSGTNFANGEYLLYTITGEVHINITLVNGPNAVASGIFFGEKGAPVSASAYFQFAQEEFAPMATSTVAVLNLPAGTFLLHTDIQLDLTGSGGGNVACYLEYGNTQIQGGYAITQVAANTPSVISWSDKYVNTAPSTISLVCSNSSTSNLLFNYEISAIAFPSILTISNGT